MDAVVVGGGIGGLSAAIALRRAGWNVWVLERAPNIREVGAGLTLMTNALRGLEALGLGAAVDRRGEHETPGGLRTTDGRWLSHVDSAEMTRVLGTTALGIHRCTLQRLLRDAVSPWSLRTAAEFVSIEQNDQATYVKYTDHGEPASIRADLVVGADGINSAVRAQLWPEVPAPVHQGSTAWRAVIKWGDPLPVAITWGPGAEFGMVPLGDSQVYWYGAVNARPGEYADDELAAVRERFGSWHDPIPELLAATPPEAVIRCDIYHLATPLPTFVRGRVALLGDAAHAMTPNLGQGAAQAIEDAVTLGAAVAGTTDVRAALAWYDAQRRPRTQAVARTSWRAGRYGQQLSNPVAVAARNTVLRWTPPKRVLQTMTRYGDWRPPTLPA